VKSKKPLWEKDFLKMAKRKTTPANHTHNRQPSAGQLADLAALLGLMQSASKISQELDALANQVGGSLEKLTERFGVPFFDVHNAYVEQIGGAKKARKTAKVRKARAKT
jgi:hypothetical protein